VRNVSCAQVWQSVAHSQGGFSIDSISPPKPGALRKNNRKMSLPDVIFECKMHENVFVGGSLP